MNQQATGHWAVGLLTMMLSFVVFITLILLFFLVALLEIVINSKDRNQELFVFFYYCAVSIDQLANVVLGPLLNAWCLEDDLPEYHNGVLLRFGHPDNTISEMLGIFIMVDGFVRFGSKFQKAVDWFFLKVFKQEEHCLDSIKLETQVALSQ